MHVWLPLIKGVKSAAPAAGLCQVPASGLTWKQGFITQSISPATSWSIAAHDATQACSSKFFSAPMKLLKRSSFEKTAKHSKAEVAAPSFAQRVDDSMQSLSTQQSSWQENACASQCCCWLVIATCAVINHSRSISCSSNSLSGSQLESTSSASTHQNTLHFAA